MAAATPRGPSPHQMEIPVLGVCQTENAAAHHRCLLPSVITSSFPGAQFCSARQQLSPEHPRWSAQQPQVSAQTRAPFRTACGQIIHVLLMQKLRALAMFFMDYMMFLAILEFLLLRISLQLPKLLNIQHNMPRRSSNHPNWLHPHSMATSYGQPYPKQSHTYSLCCTFKRMYLALDFSFLPSMYCHIAYYLMWTPNQDFKHLVRKAQNIILGLCNKWSQTTSVFTCFSSLQVEGSSRRQKSVRASALSWKMKVGQNKILKSSRGHANLAQ